jgi:hypothetical protein
MDVPNTEVHIFAVVITPELNELADKLLKIRRSQFVYDWSRIFRHATAKVRELIIRKL